MCLPATNLVSCVLRQDKLRTLMVAPGEGRALRWMPHRSTDPSWVVSFSSCGPLLSLAQCPKVEVTTLVAMVDETLNREYRAEEGQCGERGERTLEKHRRQKTCTLLMCLRVPTHMREDLRGAKSKMS